MAKKTGEVLAEHLQTLLDESSDIEGVAVVGVDGLVYSANMPLRDMDEDLTGAVAAAIYALSARSVKQLKRGDLWRTLIQGDDGNILVTVINHQTLLVALTPKNVNLGMAFAEARAMAEKLADVLSAFA